MTHHIAHILPFSSVGGVEIAALRLMKGLEGDQFHNTAFCLRAAESVARLFTEAGFEAVDYEPVEPSYRHPGAFLRNAFRLAGQSSGGEASAWCIVRMCWLLITQPWPGGWRACRWSATCGRNGLTFRAGMPAFCWR